MKTKAYPTHPVNRVRTIRELVLTNAERYQDKTLYTYVENKQEIDFTYNDYRRVYNALGTALFTLGVNGTAAAVVGDQHPDWVSAYNAVVSAGGIIVPLDREVAPEELSAFTQQTESTVLFLASDMFDKLQPFFAELTSVKHLVVFAAPLPEEKMATDPRLIHFDTLIEQGEAAIAAGNRDFLDYNRDPDTLSAILYTSGTTGTSKGVMLTETAIMAAIVGACETIELYPEDTLVSVLPIHHTYALSCNHHAVVNLGCSAYMNTSLKHALRNFEKVKPTTLVLVPLFLETMDKKVWDTIRKKGMEKQVRFLIKVSNALRAVGIDLRRKFFKDVIAAFGGNLKYIVCGGAPLNPQCIVDFDNFGICVTEGYGITECAPLISVNPLYHKLLNRIPWRKIRSVGPPIPGMDVKIDKAEGETEGEITVKGKNVFSGYYKNPEATEEAFTEDGYFRTGDIGHVDEDGFIFITGRKKNVIIASNGKNIYPEEIEEYLYRDTTIAETVVVGRKKEDYSVVITAVIFPDFEQFPDKSTEEIKEIYKGRIAAINKTLPSFKQIGEIEIRETEFEKTTTKKIKRFLVK